VLTDCSDNTLLLSRHSTAAC